MIGTASVLHLKFTTEIEPLTMGIGAELVFVRWCRTGMRLCAGKQSSTMREATERVDALVVDLGMDRLIWARRGELEPSNFVCAQADVVKRLD
jgi:hypothetical protein